MKVAMRIKISGGRGDLTDWPDPGVPFYVDDAEGAQLCAGGLAYPVAEEPFTEFRDAPVTVLTVPDQSGKAAVVKPIVSGSRNVLWTGIDRGIIDSLFVNGSAVLARGFGWIGSQMQSGETGAYAWAIAIGALAVLGAFTFR